MKCPTPQPSNTSDSPRNRRITGFVILGFFRKELEISGAKRVDVRFTVPIEAGKKFCELSPSWD